MSGPAVSSFDIVSIDEEIKVLAVGINAKKHIFAVGNAHFSVFFAQPFDGGGLFSVLGGVFGLGGAGDAWVDFELFAPHALWLKFGDVELKQGSAISGMKPKFRSLDAKSAGIPIPYRYHADPWLEIRELCVLRLRRFVSLPKAVFIYVFYSD